MFFILAAMISVCGLFCMVDLLVSLLERADRRARRHHRARAARPAAYAPVPARNIKTQHPAGALPEREDMLSFSDFSNPFVDRYLEIVNS